jgi:hypothetical protein
MHHRHLSHQDFSLAAIDDIISRGQRVDWLELRAGLQQTKAQTLAEKIQKVCEAHIADPYAQRYHFWRHYAQRHIA